MPVSTVSPLTPRIFQDRHKKFLPEEDMAEAARKLAALRKAEVFHRLSFERIIEEVRATVARHLWQLVVEEADLRGHLRALKDYFLLAKGDFFQVRAEVLIHGNPNLRVVLTRRPSGFPFLRLL